MLNRFPLILGTGPFKPDMKSCLRAIPDFIERYPAPVAQMNLKTQKIEILKQGIL
jgi:hypothetical protein